MKYYGCTYRPVIGDTRVKLTRVYTACGCVEPFWFITRTAYTLPVSISELIPIGLN